MFLAMFEKADGYWPSVLAATTFYENATGLDPIDQVQPEICSLFPGKIPLLALDKVKAASIARKKDIRQQPQQDH